MLRRKSNLEKEIKNWKEFWNDQNRFKKLIKVKKQQVIRQEMENRLNGKSHTLALNP